MHRLENYFTLQRGHDLPSQNRKNGEVPVISSSGITGYHSKAKVKGPGVITGRYGTLGKVFYEENDYWPLNTTLYVKNFKGNNPKFIYYFLKALNFDHLSSASAVPGLDRNVLHGLKIEIPKISTQNKIVSILSTYDELIDNNNQRIALLEEMAEEIYKEWFIRFRFPGHETAHFHDGLPEGWKHGVLTEKIEVLSGGTPKTIRSEYWNGKIPFFSPKDFGHHWYCFETEATITEQGLNNCNSGFFPENSIFITARGSVGNVLMTGLPMAMNQSCFSLKPVNKNTNIFCFLMIKNTAPVLRQIANGATFGAITINAFEQTKVIIPNDELAIKYDISMRPIFDHIKLLIKKNKILQQTRDLLLPRLMSGKIDLDKLSTDRQ